MEKEDLEEALESLETDLSEAEAENDQLRSKISELQELRDELEDEVELHHQQAAERDDAAGDGDTVEELRAEVSELEAELEAAQSRRGLGGDARELARLRREVRAWDDERDELERHICDLEYQLCDDTAGGPARPGAQGAEKRAAELEDKLRSLQFFGALNVVGAPLPHKGGADEVAAVGGLIKGAAEQGDEEDAKRQKKRERKLEKKLQEAATAADDAEAQVHRLEDDNDALAAENEELKRQLVSGAAEQDNTRLEELGDENEQLKRDLEAARAVAAAGGGDGGDSSSAADKAQILALQAELRTVNVEIDSTENELAEMMRLKEAAEAEASKLRTEITELSRLFQQQQPQQQQQMATSNLSKDGADVDAMEV